MLVCTRGGKVFRPTARSSLYALGVIEKLCAVGAAHAPGVSYATRRNIQNAFQHGRKNKTGKMTNNSVTPKELYDSYPAADLLDIDPPRVGESFNDYITRQSNDAILRCGDTLFAFLIFELSDAGSREEAVRMINTAASDLLAVQKHISRNTDNG